MFIQRLRSTAQLLLRVLCCHGSPAMADSDYARPVTFAVGDGVTAKAVQLDDNPIGISVLPGGATSIAIRAKARSTAGSKSATWATRHELA